MRCDVVITSTAAHRHLENVYLRDFPLSNGLFWAFRTLVVCGIGIGTGTGIVTGHVFAVANCSARIDISLRDVITGLEFLWEDNAEDNAK